MANKYIDIDWNILNLNNKNDHSLLNEITAVLEKYGYCNSEFIYGTTERFYHDDMIRKEVGE